MGMGSYFLLWVKLLLGIKGPNKPFMDYAPKIKTPKKNSGKNMGIKYVYALAEDSEQKLNRAYAILFEETLNRLASKGVRLPF